jgi:penicillin-binding protein 2
VLFRVLEDKLLELFNKKVFFYFLILSIFFGIIFFRLIYLQIFNYSKYQKISENNRIRIQRIKADRGFIKDRNGKILVRNAPSYNLAILKEDVKNLDDLLDKLSKLIDIDKTLAKKRIKKSYIYEPTIIYRGLTFKQVSYLMEHLDSYPGVEIDIDTVRVYTYPTAFSHIIGYMGEVNEDDLERDSHYKVGDLIGKSGIEKQYEKELRGINGARQVEVDSLGRVSEILYEKKPTPGKTIVLTIDSDIQLFAQQMMKGKTGSIVVTDIKNNDVLAMYSAPDYDLNLFVPYISSKNWKNLISDKTKPLMNRPIESAYPPGSVFKILMSLAALNEKVVDTNTDFLCDGKLKYGRFTYRCWKRKGHGHTKLNKAIGQSCDVYFYNVGLKLGIDKISTYAKTFSLGHKTGIDLPNEKRGSFPDREWKKKRFKQPWYPGETIITSIGQGYITTTPLQMAVMLNGIFDGGYIYAPKVVRAFEFKGKEEFLKSKLVTTFKIPEWIREELLKGMLNVVYGKHPTGWRAKVQGIKVAGKTGTAQVISLKKIEHLDKDKIPEKYRDHAWFAALFPADNPKYSIVIMVEHGGSGGRSAAPIAGAIINKMVDLGYVNRQ